MIQSQSIARRQGTRTAAARRNFRRPRTSLQIVGSRRRHPLAAGLALLGSCAAHAGAWSAMWALPAGALPVAGSGDAGRSWLAVATLPGPATGGPGADDPGAGPPAADRPSAPPASPAVRHPAPRPPRPARRDPAPPSPDEGLPVPPAEDASEAAEPSGARGETEPSDEAFLEALMARSAARGVRGVDGASPARLGGGGCPDRIEGTWKARRYHPDGRWGVFTLRIAREGRRLTGRITLHAWNGGPQDRRPPRCAPGRWEHTVRMPAEGRLDGDAVRFDALRFTRRSHCTDPGFGYNLDHFTGTVEGDRLDAVNNDGGLEVDTPYDFRRIACD